MLKVLILNTIQCVLLAIGQVCFKFAVEKIDKIRWEWTYFTDLLTNWWLIASGICMLAVTLLWGFMLKHFEFSVVYPISAFAYIFGVLAAIFIFHETVPLTRWLGVGLIMLGVFFIVK